MENTNHKIWAVALKLIERKPMSRKEVLTALLREFHEHAAGADRAVLEMERLGLISDVRLAEMLVNHWACKAVGRMKLLAEARRRGLAPELVERILLDTGWDELESGRRALEEKSRSLLKASPLERKRKLAAFLHSRGFTDPVIYQLIR